MTVVTQTPSNDTTLAWPERCMSRIEEIGHRHFSRHIASPRSLRAAAYASHRIDTLRLWCHIASHRLSQTWPSSHRIASGRMASGRIASPCICQNFILLSFCPFCHEPRDRQTRMKRIEIHRQYAHRNKSHRISSHCPSSPLIASPPSTNPCPIASHRIAAACQIHRIASHRSMLGHVV